MAIFQATQAEKDRAASASAREAEADSALEQWRDQFMLALSACGLSEQAAPYDDGGALAALLPDYFHHGWPPVEAMYNEIANDGERRLISDGPET